LKTSSLPLLVAGFCSSQVPRLPATTSSSIEILLPPGFSSDRFFVRYLVTGGGIGGWIQPRPNVSSYTIRMTNEGHSTARIRAILYYPGCAIQTFDLPVSDQGSQQYSFVCQSLRNIEIAGTLVRSDRLYGRTVRLEARYIARWAQSFLGLDDEILTFIPIGEIAEISRSGEFRLPLPDLSQDPLAGSPENPGELEIWARESVTERLVAQLIPEGLKLEKTRMGGLKIQSRYPSEIVFTPCGTNNLQVRDAIGFALRPSRGDTCDR